MGSSFGEKNRSKREMHTVESAARLITRAAEAFGPKVFIHDTKGGPPITFENLNEQVGRAAGLLRGIGIRKGSIVSLFLKNSRQFFPPWLGASRLGAVTNPINLGLERDIDRIIYMLEVTGARLFITEKEFLRAAGQIRQKAPGIRVIVVDDPGASDVDWGHGMQAAEPLLEDAPVAPSDPFQLIFTSGTTGKPKAVVQRHEMLADAGAIIDHFRLGPEHVSMAVLPFFHVNAQYTSFFPMLMTGGSMVLCERFTSAHFFEHIERFGVTYVSVVPSILTRLLAAGLPSPEAISRSLRFIICGAAPLSADVHKRFMTESGVPVANGWGMTENGCWGCHTPLDDIRPGSIGKALPINEMKIVDRKTGLDLGPDQPGGLFIRGANVFREYLHSAEATSEAFSLGRGWFDTGDDAWMDRDGFFYFIGRRSVDTGKVDGEFVNFLALDERLWAHPMIEEVCCVGVPHPLSGQVVAACVVPKNGYKFSTLELIKYCKEAGFATFEVPRHVLFVPEIPKGDTGKIQRQAMARIATDRIASPNRPPGS